MEYQNLPFILEMPGLVVEEKREANKTQLFQFRDTDFLSVIVVAFWQQLLRWHPLSLTLLASISVGFISSECSSLTSSIDLLTYLISSVFSYIPVCEFLSLLCFSESTNTLIASFSVFW